MNIPIGNEPLALSCLNDAELALVSLGRVSGHMFHIFAGSHKSIKTFHQIHVNNVGHIMGAINLLDSVGRLPTIDENVVPPLTVETEVLPLETDVAQRNPGIYCILSGPFTRFQKTNCNEKCRH
jgi:hypothetical protein